METFWRTRKKVFEVTRATEQLGFHSGDQVVNQPGTPRPFPESEVNLVSKIRDDGNDGELWWAWDDRDHRMYQVCCGRWWVLNVQRVIYREYGTFRWCTDRWVAFKE